MKRAEILARAETIRAEVARLYPEVLDVVFTTNRSAVTAGRAISQRAYTLSIREGIKDTASAHITHTIQLSTVIWRYPENEPEFRDTVLHELAHCITHYDPQERDGHGWRWRNVYRAIGGTGEIQHGLRMSNYYLTCPNCPGLHVNVARHHIKNSRRHRKCGTYVTYHKYEDTI